MNNKTEIVLERFRAMRDDTWTCRCPPAQVEWMDWLIESWEKLALEDLRLCPDGFTDRDIDTCYFVSTAWEGKYYGRWEMAIDTKNRIGYIQPIDDGKLNYPATVAYELNSDLAWFDYLLEIQRLINTVESDLINEFGIWQYYLDLMNDN